MSRLRPAAFSLLACGALISCGSSPPTRFYTLNEIAPPAGNGSSSTAGTIALRLEPVAIPAELDRPELVHHSGPNQVSIADSDRWAAPLDEQIRRALSDDLAVRLPPGLVADPNEPATHDPRRRLSISIGQFDADASCALTLSASWTLQAPGEGTQHGSERIQQPSAGACPAALPATMSRALATLADRLAATLLR
jgi:uncharacterized lipoprotein YmbA